MSVTQIESNIFSSGAGYQPKSLYQIMEGRKFTGLCNGISLFLNIDVQIVRWCFIFLTLVTKGAWFFVYLVLIVLVPVAKTSEDSASARGHVYRSKFT